MPMRKGGMATTTAPTPPAHRLNSSPQPTGTDTTNRSARRNPRLAASAVDRVVLGPGVKLAAVHGSSRALSSVLLMGWLAGVHGAHFIVKNNTLAVHL